MYVYTYVRIGTKKSDFLDNLLAVQSYQVTSCKSNFSADMMPLTAKITKNLQNFVFFDENGWRHLKLGLCPNIHICFSNKLLKVFSKRCIMIIVWLCELKTWY